MTDARPAGAPARAMTDLLELRAFRASPDKVDRVEFHPVQPWLAFVTRGNLVTVWDYESNEVRGPASVRRVGGAVGDGRQVRRNSAGRLAAHCGAARGSSTGSASGAGSGRHNQLSTPCAFLQQRSNSPPAPKDCVPCATAGDLRE